MTYLDDPRVYFAAERTMLAWQRTAIAMIGLGFVIERFGLFLRMIAMPSTGDAGYGRGLSLLFGLTLLVIGAVVASVSAIQFQRFVRGLSERELPRGHCIWFGPMVNYILTVVAAVLVGWFIVTI